MASLLKGLLGGQGPENQPSGAEIIEKLKNRYFDLEAVFEIVAYTVRYDRVHLVVVLIKFHTTPACYKLHTSPQSVVSVVYVVPNPLNVTHKSYILNSLSNII